MSIPCGKCSHRHPVEVDDSPEFVLLHSVLDNVIPEIEKVVKQNKKLLEHIYEPEYDVPILLMAIFDDRVKPETVEKLLELGADITARSELNEGWRALHFAAQRANSNVLEVILKHLELCYDPKSQIINQLANGNNALHILVKQGCAKSNDGEEQAKCAELLIKYGINVNQEDDKNRTPIFCAAKKGLKNVVKVIIDSKQPLDLDSGDVEGKTARGIILEKELYDQEFLMKVKSTYNRTDKEILFRYIGLKDEDGFKAYKQDDIYALVDSDNNESTLLQVSCGKKLTKVVQYLIENGADPNKKGPGNNKLPIEIAVQNHSSEIVQVLLETTLPHRCKISLPPTILTDILKYIDHEGNKKCYDIMKELCSEDFKRLVNSCDPSTKNTPLHFAVRYGEDIHVEELLNLGASLGAKNCFEWMPIQDMKAKILEKHLDNCIKIDEKKTKKIDKEEFTVTFDYNSLIPPCHYIVTDCPNWYRIADEEQGTELQNLMENNVQATVNVQHDLLPKTDVVEYMSQAPEFKHLLKHPVIVSFLVIKWHRICWLFYLNLIFYLIFCSSLAVYIFSHYIDFGEGDKSNARGFLGGLSYFVFFATFLILVSRELFQFFSPWKYLKNKKNYVKWFLITFAGLILFRIEFSMNTKKLLAVVSILISALEFIIMLGQHPWCSANVVMLLKVSVTFFKFLLWYSVLILAFAMSFYILFTHAGQNNTNITTGEKDEDFFKDLGQSMFKTIIMLTGEFDASSINFQTFPVTSKLLFSLFILIIVIILMNLLNSLAVNDMEKIRDNAEYMSMAQHVSYVESMLLGNVFLRSWCKDLKTKTKDNYMLDVYLNKSGDIVTDVDKNIRMRFCICNCFQRLFQNGSQISFLDSETSRKTRDIIFEKIKKEVNLVKKIEDLERKLESFCSN